MFTYEWNLRDLEKVQKNGFTVFSCFAGGGGGLVKAIKWQVTK